MERREDKKSAMGSFGPLATMSFVMYDMTFAKDGQSTRNPCYVYNNVFLMLNPLGPILTA